MIKFFITGFLVFLLFSSHVDAQVVINEFLVTPNPEWVEFYNASGSAEYLKNYWLDDDTEFNNDEGTSTKKLLTDLETSNLSYPVIEFNSFLNNPGDWVVLFDPSGNLIDSFGYTENPGDGVSIGRYPDKNGSFVKMDYPTKAAANSNPKPTFSPTPLPTFTNTPTPTLTPTPKPTSTVSPIPSFSITPTPTKKAISTKIPTVTIARQEDKEQATGVEETILGLRNELSLTPTPSLEEKEKGNFPWGAVFLILGGLSFIGAASYPFFKKTKFFQFLPRMRKEEYNDISDRKEKNTD